MKKQIWYYIGFCPYDEGFLITGYLGQDLPRQPNDGTFVTNNRTIPFKNEIYALEQLKIEKEKNPKLRYCIVKTTREEVYWGNPKKGEEKG